MSNERKIAILGAGPVGLEAALAAHEAGFEFTIYEAGETAGESLRSWGHVRLFTPWDMVISPRARRFLSAVGRNPARGETCPTGQEVYDQLLQPIADLPEISKSLRLSTEVVSVSRSGLHKNEAIGDAEARRAHPFRLLLTDGEKEWIETAEIVLDCTGTYRQPNPVGNGGIPAPGERSHSERIHRHLPDFEADWRDWAGRRVLLVGGGHSGQTAAVGLAAIAHSHPGTKIFWALRGDESPEWQVEDDPLPERARLSRQARDIFEGSCAHLTARTGVVVEAIRECGGGLAVQLRDARGLREEIEVDRILSLTGFIGDHQIYRQLQVHECWATSGPMKLSAALLGAGSQDCLDQASHGPETLAHPEPDFFILGIKSYGKTSSFLLQVGWSQVDEVFSLLS